MKLHFTPELSLWLLITGVGTGVSVFSGRELARSIEAVRTIASRYPQRATIVSIAEHNLRAERLRTFAHGMSLTVGLISLLVGPRRMFQRPRAVDRLLPWLLVLMEATLVLNSVNEFFATRHVLKPTTSPSSGARRE